MKMGMRLLVSGTTAAVLLFGMIFCLAAAHFAGFVWRQSWSMVFYGTLFGWVAGHVWMQRLGLRRIVLTDVLFVLFVIVVLSSSLPLVLEDPAAAKFVRYLPFMVVVPYLCGRIMGARDVRHLAGAASAGGVVMIALLAIDFYLNFQAYSQYGRWPFFGYNHSALLIGMLLALTLVALTHRFLNMGSAAVPPGSQLITLSATWLVAVALVFVAARGALIASAVAVSCLAVISKGRTASSRASFVLALVVVVTGAFMMLPRPQAQFYASLLTNPDDVFGGVHSFRIDPRRTGGSHAKVVEPRPILGAASCKPFEQGVNSVAMRWVLYREALAIFMERPWFGVGAAGFGRFSCTGVAGFPHSTVLQALAELGIVGGGLLYLGLLLSAFMRLGRGALDATSAERRQIAGFALATFVMYVVADQLYGNYFMATGSYLMIGIAAGIRS
jgi:hypothetical protein